MHGHPGHFVWVVPDPASGLQYHPVLPHLRMLLSLDRCSSGSRLVGGCTIARRIGGLEYVAECPLQAASVAPLAVRGMTVSAALRLIDRNKRCTMVCCGGPTVRGVVQRGGDLPARSDGVWPPNQQWDCASVFIGWESCQLALPDLGVLQAAPPP